MRKRLDLTWSLLFVGSLCASECRGGAPAGWTALFEEPPTDSWISASDARLDPDDSKKLIGKPGAGVLISTRRGGKAQQNLISQTEFRDVELELEFLLARRSNAGVKMHGLYEVQLYDSYGVAKPKGTDCGGIYPRAVREPKYHVIDEGKPPMVNAAREAGVWQAVSIRFRSPRFDASGKKTGSAVFEEVRINGQVVQENAVVDWPTGAYWRLPETPLGPVYLQGDHGPVAYRNVRVRPLASNSTSSLSSTPLERTPADLDETVEEGEGLRRTNNAGGPK